MRGLGRLGEAATPALPTLFAWLDFGRGLEGASYPGAQARLDVRLRAHDFDVSYHAGGEFVRIEDEVEFQHLAALGVLARSPLGGAAREGALQRLASQPVKELERGSLWFSEVELACARAVRSRAPSLPASLGTLLEKGTLAARAAALTALIAVEEDALLHRARVVPLARDERASLRRRAFEALEAMGAPCDPELEALARSGLDDRDEGVELRATALLLASCEAAEAGVRPLLGLLGSRRPDVRAEAARLLGVAGPVDRAIVPRLARALGDSELAVQTAAAHALGRMGSAARPARSRLQKLAEAEDRELRAAVATALRAIGD